MPEVILNCPKCQRQLRVTDELIGRPVKCPACGLTFTIPAGGTEPQLAPVPVLEEAPPRPRPRPLDEPGAGDEHYPGQDEYGERHFRPRGEAWDYDHGDRARAHSKVLPPAICLLVTAVLGILIDLFQVVYATMPAPPADPRMPAWLQQFQQGAHEPTAIIFGGIFALLSLVVLIASIQMMRLRSHGLAVAGSVLAMLNLGNLCCLLGLPFGIWSLVVLMRPDVRNAFQGVSPPAER